MYAISKKQWKTLIGIAFILLISLNLGATEERRETTVRSTPGFSLMSDLWLNLVSFLNDRSAETDKAVAMLPLFSVEGDPDDDDDPEG